MSATGLLASLAVLHSTAQPDIPYTTVPAHISYSSRTTIAGRNTASSPQCTHTAAAVHCLYRHTATDLCKSDYRSHTVAVHQCSDCCSSFGRFGMYCLGITGCNHNCWLVDFNWTSFVVGSGRSRSTAIATLASFAIDSQRKRAADFDRSTSAVLTMAMFALSSGK